MTPRPCQMKAIIRIAENPGHVNPVRDKNISKKNHGHKNKKKLYPNIADLHRGKTHQSTPDVAEHGPAQGGIVAYLTVCEILADASPALAGFLPVWVCNVRVKPFRVRFSVPPNHLYGTDHDFEKDV